MCKHSTISCRNIKLYCKVNQLLGDGSQCLPTVQTEVLGTQLRHKMSSSVCATECLVLSYVSNQTATNFIAGEITTNYKEYVLKINDK